MKTKKRNPQTTDELLKRVINACSDISYPLGNEGVLWLWGKQEFKDAWQVLDARLVAKDLAGGIKAGKALVALATALVNKTLATGAAPQQEGIPHA